MPAESDQTQVPASGHTLTGLPLRSLLFCPGSDARRMGKAMAAGADVVIFDLEDSVAPSAKDEARVTVVEMLATSRPCPVAVRLNAADTTWHLNDLVGVMAARPDAIMLPKCASRADLVRLSAQIDVLEAAFDIRPGSTAILPLVTETATALSTMDYAGATPRLAALCFAGEDLASDLGVAARPAGEMNALLTGARHAVAYAAASAGVAAIDTPFPDPRAPESLTAETRRAATLGFAGKLCIHPAQIEIVHQVLRPTPQQLAWGAAVVAALVGSDTGVATVQGKMVDIAHLRLARRYLALGQACSQTTEASA